MIRGAVHDDCVLNSQMIKQMLLLVVLVFAVLLLAICCWWCMGEVRPAMHTRTRMRQTDSEKPPTLNALHIEMLKAFWVRDFDEAMRIANSILTREDGHEFIPAHMVIGKALVQKQDWAGAEPHLRKVIEARGSATPSLILNDYADTLRHQHRYDEAVRYAKMAIKAETPDRWHRQ